MHLAKYQHSTMKLALVEALVQMQLEEPVGAPAWVLLEAVVCHWVSVKVGKLIAGEPLCEGILLPVYVEAAFARVPAML